MAKNKKSNAKKRQIQDNAARILKKKGEIMFDGHIPEHKQFAVNPDDMNRQQRRAAARRNKKG